MKACLNIAVLLIFIFPFFSQAEQVLAVKNNIVIAPGWSSFPLIQGSQKHLGCDLIFPPSHLERVIVKDKQFLITSFTNMSLASLTPDELRDIATNRYGILIWDFGDDVVGAIERISNQFGIQIPYKINKIVFSVKSLSTGNSLKIRCLSVENFTANDAITDIIRTGKIGITTNE